MGIKKREFTFENLTFKLSVDLTNQLSFAYLVPEELSEYEPDPWDAYFWDGSMDIINEPERREWSYDFEGLPTDTSIFKIKSFLIESIAHFIHEHHLVYFWYKPTTPQRERIFTLFIDKFIEVLESKMGLKWTYQKVEDYFHLNAIEDLP